MGLTLEDIGRMAGVSRSTVSRVINGDAQVGEDARQRVQDVVRRTGYTPNVAARSLVSSRTGVIGLVIPSRVNHLFEDPYFARVIQGVSAACNRAGKSLSLFVFQTEDEERDLYPRVVGSGFVDGVIITATHMGDPLLARMVDSEIPLAMVGRPDIDGVSYVDVDNRDGARQAAAHLCGLGYQRIALLGAPTNTTAGLDRLEGFVKGLGESERALDPGLRADGDFSERSGYDAMRALIRQRPDAVFVASDTMAMGALRAMRETGLEAPSDIAVVGFDDLAPAVMSTQWLTTVRQPVAATAERAVQLVIELIHGEVTPPVSEVMPVELIVRASCGAAPAATAADPS